MTDETKDHLISAWLPISLVSIAVLGLIAKAVMLVVPYFWTAVTAALD